MSIIVRPILQDGPAILLCKGADSSIFKRSINSQKYKDKLESAIEKHEKSGLRTLVIARKELTDEEADAFEV